MSPVHSLAAWLIFGFLMIGMLVMDLGVFHRKARVDTFRQAMGWSVVWILLALLFNLGVSIAFGHQKGMEFLAAYLIEKSLSVDNLFVFVAIFSYFSVEPSYQHRVLFWGILGALVMRGIFISAGLALIHQFQWVTYLLGAFLVFTGIRFMKEEESVQPEKNPVIRLFKGLVPLTSVYHGHRFFIRIDKRWLATPLLLVLFVVEVTDVIFATDSVPAVLAVSLDPFIVYTSNVFAILGLRALYFVLSGIIPRFVYLRYGICTILIFVGLKMLLAGVWKVPIGISLAVIAAILVISIGLSLLVTRSKSGEGEE